MPTSPRARPCRGRRACEGSVWRVSETRTDGIRGPPAIHFLRTQARRAARRRRARGLTSVPRCSRVSWSRRRRRRRAYAVNAFIGLVSREDEYLKEVAREVADDAAQQLADRVAAPVRRDESDTQAAVVRPGRPRRAARSARAAAAREATRVQQRRVCGRDIRCTSAMSRASFRPWYTR